MYVARNELIRKWNNINRKSKIACFPVTKVKHDIIILNLVCVSILVNGDGHATCHIIKECWLMKNEIMFKIYCLLCASGPDLGRFLPSLGILGISFFFY